MGLVVGRGWWEHNELDFNFFVFVSIGKRKMWKHALWILFASGFRLVVLCNLKQPWLDVQSWPFFHHLFILIHMHILQQDGWIQLRKMWQPCFLRVFFLPFSCILIFLWCRFPRKSHFFTHFIVVDFCTCPYKSLISSFLRYVWVICLKGNY